jgi:hypothetical protein
MKAKGKTGGKSKAVREPRRKKKADEKQPPFDIAKQWLMPWFTLEDSGGKYHMASRPKVFDLELLGNVAARLLTGTDYIQAAHRAYMLLLACEALNYHVSTKQEALTKHVAQLNESDLPQIVPFERAVRFVTGQQRTDRAIPYFRKLFEALCKYSSVTEQNQHFEEMKERGFTKAYVLHLKDTFEFLRNYTGELRIRKPPKKSLTEK